MSGISGAGAVEEFAATAILERGLPATELAAVLALNFPDERAMGFIFAMTCVASALEIEAPHQNGTALPDPAPLWRAAALLGTDIHEYSILHGAMPNGAQMLVHWTASATRP